MSGQDGLVTSEGVDEGSAAEVAEDRTTGGGDVLGEPPHGAPVDDEQAAAPVDMESEQSRAAREEQGSGQQLAAGEG